MSMCRVNVWFTLALCMQFVLAWRVLMSPGCSQCGEEGCSVHGRRAGRQSRQSTGEPAGQRRYSDGYNTVRPDYFSTKKSRDYQCRMQSKVMLVVIIITTLLMLF